MHSILTLKCAWQVVQEVESHWTSGRRLPAAPAAPPATPTTLQTCFSSIDAAIASRQRSAPDAQVNQTTRPYVFYCLGWGVRDKGEGVLHYTRAMRTPQVSSVIDIHRISYLLLCMQRKGRRCNWTAFVHLCKTCRIVQSETLIVSQNTISYAYVIQHSSSC